MLKRKAKFLAIKPQVLIFLFASTKEAINNISLATTSINTIIKVNNRTTEFI